MFTRLIEEKQLKQIVYIHSEAFKESFLTSLGYEFLYVYYKSLMLSKNGLLLGLFVRGELVGFAAGNTSNRNFNKLLVICNLALYLPLTIKILLRNPSALIRLKRNISKGEIANRKECLGELSSIGLIPSLQGKGFGRQLLEDFVKESRKRGVKALVLTTDFEDNDRSINFYKNAGFERLELITSFENRKMLKLMKKF